ncbi:aspartoacylase [Phormidium tenue FACHB-886]|nr:aspartoacylase [Phormidium tenue FACHB-886]
MNSTEPTSPIQRVAIVGGTHGNELTGAYLIKKFEQFPALVQRSSFETTTLLANPKAFAAGRRYIDRDLNRCFLRQDLANPSLTSYEDQQAKQIYQQLSISPHSKVEVLIDLHSSTANMGMTIIPANYHPFNLRLAAYLNNIHPNVKVYQWAWSAVQSPVLRSICEWGCAIEVGAIAQGILDAVLFQQTEMLIQTTLDYLDAYSLGKPLPAPETVTIYQCTELLDYPRNAAGELLAMVHPQLQFRDYQPLTPGEPLFLTLDGQTIAYTGESTVYPVFINEAAYYEKGIAMCLTQPQEINIAESASASHPL